MLRALAGHASQSFAVPGQVVFAEIDPDTGYLAGPGCPRTLNESFMPGTAPTQICPHARVLRRRARHTGCKRFGGTALADADAALSVFVCVNVVRA